MSELDLKGAHERYMAALLGLRDNEEEPKTDPMIRIPPQPTAKICAICGTADVYVVVPPKAQNEVARQLCYGCFLEDTTRSWAEYCAGNGIE